MVKLGTGQSSSSSSTDSVEGGSYEPSSIIRKRPEEGGTPVETTAAAAAPTLVTPEGDNNNCDRKTTTPPTLRSTSPFALNQRRLDGIEGLMMANTMTTMYAAASSDREDPTKVDMKDKFLSRFGDIRMEQKQTKYEAGRKQRKDCLTSSSNGSSNNNINVHHSGTIRETADSAADDDNHYGDIDVFNGLQGGQCKQQQPQQQPQKQQQPLLPNCWSYDQHRDFISAILDVGIQNCVPTTIQEQMVLLKPPLSPALIGKKLKSHLQKFRQHQDQQLETFMAEYDTSLLELSHPTQQQHHIPQQQRFHDDGGGGGVIRGGNACTSFNPVMVTEKLLVGGRAAAELTYSILKSESPSLLPSSPFTPSTAAAHHDVFGTSTDQKERQRSNNNTFVDLSKEEEEGALSLTQEEIESPLGKAIVFVYGAIEQMYTFLSAEREAATVAAAAGEQQEVVDPTAVEKTSVLLATLEEAEEDPVDMALKLSSEFAHFSNIGLDVNGKPLSSTTKTSPGELESHSVRTSRPIKTTKSTRQGCPKQLKFDRPPLGNTDDVNKSSKLTSTVPMDDGNGGRKRRLKRKDPPSSSAVAPTKRERRCATDITSSSTRPYAVTKVLGGDEDDDSSRSSLSESTTTAKDNDSPVMRMMPIKGQDKLSSPVLSPVAGLEAEMVALPQQSTTMLLTNPVSPHSLKTMSKSVVANDVQAEHNDDSGTRCCSTEKDTEHDSSSSSSSSSWRNKDSSEIGQHDEPIDEINELFGFLDYVT